MFSYNNFPNTSHLDSLGNSQRGATLIVALILLVIMTVIGVGAAQVSKMQFQMVKNMQLELDAYQYTLSELNGQVDRLNNGNIDELQVLSDDEIMTERAVAANTVDTSLSGFQTGNIINSNKSLAITSTLQYVATTPSSQNNSIDTMANKYIIKSDVKIGSSNIGSKQAYGIEVIVAKGTGAAFP